MVHYQPDASSAHMQTATLAGGCFWCVEAAFNLVEGVESAVSGYTGGTTPNPTYEEICTGNTGHTEAVRIRFDPHIVTYLELLDVFWKIHDPTTLNRQGADVGSQYRSAIFYHHEQQKNEAGESILRLDRSGLLPRPVVTEITPASTFFPAEEYHQQYYQRNPNAPYCRVVITPKLKKTGLTHYQL